jgi:hypothetical protein
MMAAVSTTPWFINVMGIGVGLDAITRARLAPQLAFDADDAQGTLAEGM